MTPTAPHGHSGRESAGRSPRLCVGLPVYNGEQYIEETLDSLLSQTFDDFELVISDNASTDATPRIVRSYAERDERIRCVLHAQNRGASANFHGAWQECRSEYFKWVAADDPCGPRFLEACVDALDARPSAGLAYPRAAFINEDSTILYEFDDLLRTPEWSRDSFTRARQAIALLLRQGSVANVMIFGVIRSQVLRTIQPIGNYFGADLPLVGELAMAAEVIEVPELAAFYRRHEASSSSYARSPSASSQQEFYDPSVRGRARLEWNLRRRYLELTKVAGAVPLDPGRRALLVGTVFQAMARRLAWRLKFEADMRRGVTAPEPRWDGPPTRWSNYRA